MGLDSYLYITKSLSPDNEVEQEYIEYFDTLDQSKIKKGLFLSEYLGDTKPIDTIDSMRRIKGQRGEPKLLTLLNGSYVLQCEVAYWRKCNAIHNYFVENCQGGVDNCESSIVPIEVLQDLKEKIDKILNGVRITKNYTPSANTISLANELLPTQDGFFFGSTEYDNWYFINLRLTQRKLKQLLNADTTKKWGVLYEASW